MELIGAMAVGAYILYIVFTLALLVGVVWAIVDISKRRMKTIYRVLWIIGLIMLSFFTLILYFFIRKKYKKRRK
jgi:hypothetical protein